MCYPQNSSGAIHDDSGTGYYQDFAKYMSARTVVRSERLRADDFVQAVINAWGLTDFTNTYDLIHPLSEGNDGDIYKLVHDAVPYVLKIYKTGLNRQYVEFQQDLKLHANDPKAKAHPGFEAVYFTAVPVGWATHMGKKGLVFRYVVQPRKARLPTASDRAQVKAQMKFLHWLGYVHLDITKRNILLADNDKCFLMDFDCVCKLGKMPLGPLPPESSEPIARRDPAQIDDDLHLWVSIQGVFFEHLDVDDTTADTYKAVLNEEKKAPLPCE